MAQSPEELRREIEETRLDLSRDVDLLNEKVSPGRIVGRRVERGKGAVVGLKERVMGTSPTGTSSLGERAGSMSDRAGSALSDAVTSGPSMARQRTQGNPLAAGLIAFASGWLISSLLPASKPEEQAARAVQDKASDLAGPAKEQLSQAAQEIKDNLQEPAQQAVEAVRESATQAAETVRSDGQSAAQTVGDEAKSSTRAVRESTQGGGSH